MSEQELLNIKLTYIEEEIEKDLRNKEYLSAYLWIQMQDRLLRGVYDGK